MANAQAIYYMTNMNPDDAMVTVATAIDSLGIGKYPTRSVDSVAGLTIDAARFGSFGPMNGQFGYVITGIADNNGSPRGVLVFIQPGMTQKKRASADMRSLADKLGCKLDHWYGAPMAFFADYLS
jgi:hypothetical protein